MIKIKSNVGKNVLITCSLAMVLYLSGVVTGYYAHRLYEPRSFKHKRFNFNMKMMMCKRISKRLDLTKEQQDKVAPAIDLWYKEMESLRREHAPAYGKVFNNLFEQIDKVLTPPQKQKLEEFRQELKKRHHPDKRPIPKSENPK